MMTKPELQVFWKRVERNKTGNTNVSHKFAGIWTFLTDLMTFQHFWWFCWHLNISSGFVDIRTFFTDLLTLEQFLRIYWHLFISDWFADIWTFFMDLLTFKHWQSKLRSTAFSSTTAPQQATNFVNTKHFPTKF